jgi:hypothetical protein
MPRRKTIQATSVAEWPLALALTLPPPNPEIPPKLTETEYQFKKMLMIRTIAPIPEIMIERGMSPKLGPAGDAGGGLEDGSESIVLAPFDVCNFCRSALHAGDDVEIRVERLANDR